jgi:serine/threonine-protein kinase
MAHIIQAPQPVSEVASDLSPLLDAPVLRMLEKDPSARPSSAGEAVAALRRAAEEAGIVLNGAPLHLPRPEPAVSGEHSVEDTESSLPDFQTTEPDPGLRAAASVPSGAQRPLWPFALGLLLLGAALGFAVLRPPAAATAPAGPPSTSVADVAPPAAVEPPAAVAVVPPEPSVPAPAVSASVTPSAKPPAAKPSKPRPTGPARIPTDLENPF